MEETYRLGKHEFATREEWEAAKRDLEKIETIVDHLDIDDPEIAKDIYHFVREGKVTFESKLGTIFFCDISDRVAQNFEYKLKRNKKQQKQRREIEQQKEDQQKLKETQQSTMFKFLGIACVVLSLICILFYGISVFRERSATKKLEEVQQQKNISQALDWYADRIRRETEESRTNVQQAEPVETETEKPLEVLPEYTSMHNQYPQLAGWIYIQDTMVDLPVMQTTDNAYYLDKNIDGAKPIFRRMIESSLIRFMRNRIIELLRCACQM